MGWRSTVHNYYQAAVRALVRAIFKVFFGYRTLGIERLPRQGPVILAPNHLSYLDPMLVAIGIHRNVRMMAWAALFRHRVFAALIRSLGAFPIDIDTWDVAAFRVALNCLKEGGWLVIFPEGRRSDDGRPQPLRAGVAHLALRTGSVVVPVRIEGSYEAWPRHNRLPRLFHRCRLQFGQPIPAPKLQGRDLKTRHAAAAALLEEIREALERPIDEAR